MELAVEKINKSFGEKHVLKDVSLKARPGVALGLLGRNGAGKTTLIRIIMGLFPADSGSVTIGGVPREKSRYKIGYLPEERGLYPKRVIADQMGYIGALRGMKMADANRRAQMLLEKLEAGEYYKQKLETLSKGNQQKIQLAIALINDPDIVILDELFSGLDPVNAKLLKNLVRELVAGGKLVFFSSHQMGYVEEFCDDVCMINHGEIVLDGNLRQIRKSYPRNRVMVVPADGHLEQLGTVLKNMPGLAAVEEKPDGFAVTLADEKEKPAFWNGLTASGIELDSFSVIEPTLEEIFVEKAGDDDAEV